VLVYYLALKAPAKCSTDPDEIISSTFSAAKIINCSDHNIMALQTSIPALLDTLTNSLSASCESSEKIPSLIPPKDGISLLDVKNELFLSYLQNLVFLILLKIRNRKGDPDKENEYDLDNSIVQKLVELTVYVERGVLKLEGQLKYQIDKVLRAAQDASNSAKINGAAQKANTAEESEEEDDDEEDNNDESSDGGVALKASEIDDLQYRPNPSALVRPTFGAEEPDDSNSKDGVYRPPRIQATAMPTTERRDKEAKRPNKSATLDEFVSTEMSSAPLAEPSIGSHIVDGGRRTKSEKEKRDEIERREYEERNYTRLPKESKKERAKKAGRRDAGYGGEEWRGLGEGLDRIERLTKRKSGEGRSVLEKSRKRPADGDRRSGGAELGQGFQKRLKTMNRERRDRGRG
jgi:U3 small nucleolar ribonucleoprotein protein LCP5